ncbi:hypothetical protein WL93_03035 [Burkholderia diffusa]|uniref:hypothetical protein n=1 Tax=Burkholderia diffusa TaxID=488732 RepID=UPI00076C7034|nr:hypothetical protein [Burkholderia diffusa]KWF97477.1 hypothetical protein WL93_03035 [Burkholderia diffusa]
MVVFFALMPNGEDRDLFYRARGFSPLVQSVRAPARSVQHRLKRGVHFGGIDVLTRAPRLHGGCPAARDELALHASPCDGLAQRRLHEHRQRLVFRQHGFRFLKQALTDR